MRALIVEDETAAYENLAQMLTSIDPAIEIVGNTESVRQTVRWLENNTKPDIIFMDIHLSDGSAFTIFEMMEVATPIIFTTAYDQYAIDAFRVNSVDYLLKPVKQERLESALRKFKRLSHTELTQYLEQITRLRPARRYKDKMLLPVKDKLIPINLKDVACFYKADKSTQVFLRDGTTYQYSKALEQIATTLNPLHFTRANKQYIISRDSVTDITIWFDNRLRISLEVETPEHIYISKNKASEFKEWITNEDTE